MTTAHPGFNGNVAPVVTADDMEIFGGFIFELMQPPNPIRNLDNSLTPTQRRGKAYFFSTLTPDDPDRVSHMASGAPPLYDKDDPQPYMEGEPVGFTCNDCHRLSPEHGFYGTDGHASPSGEAQVMKTAQLRNLYAKVGMFGIPDKAGFRTYPDSNIHRGDQVRGFGFQNNGAMDTLFDYLQGEVFASDQYPDVGFKSQQQRRDLEAWLLAFDNDLAPIVGQQITLNAAISTQTGLREAVLQRIELMKSRSKAPWEAKECGGSKSAPVTECDLVVRGVVNGVRVGALFHPVTDTFLGFRMGDDVLVTGDPGTRMSGDVDMSLTPDQIISLAETGANSLTFTCMPPGSGRHAIMTNN